MTEERKTELNNKLISWLCEHISDDEDLFHTLHDRIGMTEEELNEQGIDYLDKFFSDHDRKTIAQLADYAISECTQHSEDGSWSISYEELYYHFGAEVTDANQNGKLLEEELRQRDEINELIMTEDCIEMSCHLEYCERCGNDPANLLSVVGCNIYDEHEHESAEHSDEEAPQTLSM